MMNNHRHNRLLLLISMALMLVILSLVVSGCSTMLIASGTVYEWVDAPAGADGEIYVDMAAPSGRIIEPMADIRIASFGGAVTTKNGTFTEKWGVPPGRLRMVDVKIEKEGYQTIEGAVALQALKKHSFVIFLVRQ
jgi:hypothetical protein